MLGQGELLGRGRALAKALEHRARRRPSAAGLAPGTPRSGLGPAVEADSPRCGCPARTTPKSRELRLDPLRSDLDGRREILLQRLQVCGVGYGEPIAVVGHRRRRPRSPPAGGWPGRRPCRPCWTWPAYAA